MKPSESLHSSWTPWMWCPPSPSETGWTSRDHCCPTAAPSVCLDPSLRPRYRKLCSFHKINLFFQSFVVKSGLSEKCVSREKRRWNTKYLMTLLVGVMKSGGKFFNTFHSLMPICLNKSHLFTAKQHLCNISAFAAVNICVRLLYTKRRWWQIERCHLVVVPAGVGVWTGTHRDLSATYRCVDMADGMDLKVTDVLQPSEPSELTLTLLDVFAFVLCQEGSSVVTTAEDNVCLSAGDSFLVPEQSWWVQLTDRKLTHAVDLSKFSPSFQSCAHVFRTKIKPVANTRDYCFLWKPGGQKITSMWKTDARLMKALLTERTSRTDLRLILCFFWLSWQFIGGLQMLEPKLRQMCALWGAATTFGFICFLHIFLFNTFFFSENKQTQHRV